MHTAIYNKLNIIFAINKFNQFIINSIIRYLRTA